MGIAAVRGVCRRRIGITSPSRVRMAKCQRRHPYSSIPLEIMSFTPDFAPY
ncbi:hypothetical protein ASZ90_016664 [hydrocarbon metagenome]|uniref:Uncharacterized protein n=1 Tax=hydrocarbon metagenome TaxID=938273 RepID=A0A0W8EKG1_9ZZZZ